MSSALGGRQLVRTFPSRNNDFCEVTVLKHTREHQIALAVSSISSSRWRSRLCFSKGHPEESLKYVGRVLPNCPAPPGHPTEANKSASSRTHMTQRLSQGRTRESQYGPRSYQNDCSALPSASEPRIMAPGPSARAPKAPPRSTKQPTSACSMLFFLLGVPSQCILQARSVPGPCTVW